MNWGMAYIACVLVAIEAAILLLSRHERTKGFFKYLPSMFWIYLLPMLASTAGILPNKSEVYIWIAKYCLPASLALLLLSVDIKAILKLGPVALAMMGASVVGVMAGAAGVMGIYKTYLPGEMWKGIGSLSASWIGGSANMIAVKEAINTPDAVFLPMVIVDTIVPYTWMAILIAAAAYEGRLDKMLCARRTLIDDLVARAKVKVNVGALSRKYGFLAIVVLCAAAAVVSVVLAGVLERAGAGPIPVGMAGYLKKAAGVLNAPAWSIVIATFIGIGLSFTRARNLEANGSSGIGFALLYLVLASIGAKASLANFANAPILLTAGFTWIAIHAIIVLGAARVLRAPIALAAAASQACIGGPASAPVVAGVYHAQLAPVGLLLAVLGNISGTFLGLLVSQMCKRIAM
ncbi:MAG: hypothetical protein A2Y12_03995 [Planctomycetes bacterium GWF2_42_9]|nr:MAG: hypothetical protein A2Y12_03995 [Planctomycetes bacterium GWF2_42_9]